MKITSASPILHVRDLGKAIAFYVNVLGFTQEFVYGEPPYYAGVKRDDVIFHLNASHENASRVGMGSVYVFCNEVDTYYDVICRNGAAITSALNTWPYAMRDFQTRDPDGNLICFGCPVEADGNR